MENIEKGQIRADLVRRSFSQFEMLCMGLLSHGLWVISRVFGEEEACKYLRLERELAVLEEDE